MAKPSKPGPTITEKPIIRQDPECTLLRFECRMTSDTVPEITWFHNDGRIKPNERLVVAQKDEGNNTYFCTLDVKDPGRNDAGKYQIRARNKDGESTATVLSYFG